jgi:hypothetical protein
VPKPRPPEPRERRPRRTGRWNRLSRRSSFGRIRLPCTPRSCREANRFSISDSSGERNRCSIVRAARVHALRLPRRRAFLCGVTPVSVAYRSRRGRSSHLSCCSSPRSRHPFPTLARPPRLRQTSGNLVVELHPADRLRDTVIGSTFGSSWRSTDMWRRRWCPGLARKGFPAGWCRSGRCRSACRSPSG